MQKQLRIVVATAGTDSEQELFSALPILSGSKQLKVEAVFVRETGLLRAAAQPLSREVLPSGSIRELSHQRTNAQLKHAAARVRRQLAELAQSHSVPTSFIELEGFESNQMHGLLGTADFVVVARSGWPRSLRSRKAYRTLPLVVENTNTLFVNEPWSSGKCVVAAFDGEQSLRALRVASRYATAVELPLIVATIKQAELPPELRDSVAEQVYLPAASSTAVTEQIANLVDERDARLLVLENTVTDNWLDLLPLLFDRVPCSVLHLAGTPLHKAS